MNQDFPKMPSDRLFGEFKVMLSRRSEGRDGGRRDLGVQAFGLDRTHAYSKPRIQTVKAGSATMTRART